MKPKRYPYSGQKKESTFKTIDVMIDGNGSVEFIRNNRLAQIYSLEKEGNMNEIEKIFPYQEKEILSEVTTLQKSLYCQTEHLSDQLTKKLHHLEDYNSPIDDEAIRLAEVTAEFYKLLIQSPSIGAVVKEIVSEGHKR